MAGEGGSLAGWEYHCVGFVEGGEGVREEKRRGGEAKINVVGVLARFIDNFRPSTRRDSPPSQCNLVGLLRKLMYGRKNQRCCFLDRNSCSKSPLGYWFKKLTRRPRSLGMVILLGQDCTSVLQEFPLTKTCFSHRSLVSHA